MEVTETNGLPNVFEGEIEEIIYLGEHVKYLIRLGNSTRITAKWLLNADSNLYKQGERVRIGWQASDMLAV